jgi:hypothetical protein
MYVDDMQSIVKKIFLAQMILLFLYKTGVSVNVGCKGTDIQKHSKVKYLGAALHQSLSGESNCYWKGQCKVNAHAHKTYLSHI